MIYLPDRSGVGGASFPANSLSPNDPVFEAWEYEMVFHFIEILDSKFPFFSIVTKFQQCVFRRIHWILTSPDGPTKVLVRRCLNLELCSTLIEYENEKAKPAHYLIQIIDCDDLND